MSDKIISPPIRELICQRCDEVYPIWFTHNDLWNEVCSDKKEIQFLCPTCFAVLAEQEIGHKIWTLNLDNSEKDEAMLKALDSIPIYNRPHKFQAYPKLPSECMTCDRNIADTIHTTE